MSMEPSAILQNFALSEPQQAAALTRGRDVAVTAGAGTGKTRTLVARYLALLADDVPLRQIVAVTFTRKAAREMRNRVRGEIGRYLQLPALAPDERRRWQGYYNELDAARIGTIHSLCGEILRAHPAEVGIDPRFGVLDETQAALLVQETVEAALAWAAEQAHLGSLFELLRERSLLDMIVALLDNRLVVQEIMDRVPAGGVQAHWQTRLEAAQAKIVAQLLAHPDFVAARRTLRLNRATTPDDKLEQQRQLALAALNPFAGESLAGTLRRLAQLNEINLNGGSQKSWSGGKEQLEEVKGALRLLREAYREQPLLALSLNDQDAAIAAAMPAIYDLFQYAQQTYQARKAEREALDFTDLEALAVHLLETRPEICAYWQGQIAALLVDEFQDTNALQCRFIRLLCPDAGKLFIVGDAKQSIYRFRGADIAVFAAEKGRIAGQDGHLIDLDTSYRAHELLLAGMNRLLQPVLGDDSPERPPWVAPFAALRPGTKPAAATLSPPFVAFHLTLGNKAEALPRAAAVLAARLQQLHREQGLDFGDMAILCRASGSFQYYENALDAAGVPYLTVAGKGFYARPEIRDLLNALQAIADPLDNLALAGLLRSPACGLSDVSLYQLVMQGPAGDGKVSLWQVVQQDPPLASAAETRRLQGAVALIRELNQQAGRIPVADVFKQFLDRTCYRAILRRIGQPRALRNVAKLLADIHSSQLVSVSEFLEYAQTVRDSGSREGEARATAGGAVQIMSIHAAKGLEFPVLVLGDAGRQRKGVRGILVDPDLGVLLPTKSETQTKAASYALGVWAAQAQEEAEAARLLYVAITRAEQMLLISGTAAQKKSGGLSWAGWLGQLAEITGIGKADLSDYDETGSREHVFDYSLQETAIRASFYEPEFAPPGGSPWAAPVGKPLEQPAVTPLQMPLSASGLVTAAEDETPPRIWQVVPTAQRPQAPAWVIGSIVHEALVMWRFPRPGFADWAAARAREYGLTNFRQVEHVQDETARLLGRFQQHPLFQEIAAAERRLHELPYSYQRQDGVETGYIDLLYQRAGAWILVDFKTDEVRDEVALRRLLAEQDYRQQIQRYGMAVRHLLGIVPQLKLCFLNMASGIRVVDELLAG